MLLMWMCGRVTQKGDACAKVSLQTLGDLYVCTHTHAYIHTRCHRLHARRGAGVSERELGVDAEQAGRALVGASELHAVATRRRSGGEGQVKASRERASRKGTRRAVHGDGAWRGTQCTQHITVNEVSQCGSSMGCSSNRQEKRRVHVPKPRGRLKVDLPQPLPVWEYSSACVASTVHMCVSCRHDQLTPAQRSQSQNAPHRG